MEVGEGGEGGGGEMKEMWTAARSRMVSYFLRLKGWGPGRGGGRERGTVPPPTLDPQPSTLDPRPSTLDPQPSTLNPRPSTLDPKHQTQNPQTLVYLAGVPSVGSYTLNHDP
jgi:hypothetical protein